MAVINGEKMAAAQLTRESDANAPPTPPQYEAGKDSSWGHEHVEAAEHFHSNI